MFDQSHPPPAFSFLMRMKGEKDNFFVAASFSVYSALTTQPTLAKVQRMQVYLPQNKSNNRFLKGD